MKLLTLNIWGGHVRDPLLGFIEKHQDIDIFCFQEVYHNSPHKICDIDLQVSLNIFSEFQNLLPNHIGYFRPTVRDIYGNAIFVKNTFNVLDEGEVWVHDNPDYKGSGPTHSRNLHWVEIEEGDKQFTVMNFHGLWNGQGKTDSPERINQSENIKSFIHQTNTPKILCGDFNLRPDTESLKIIETNMRNLIREHNITSTRTSYYPKEERYADYVFTCNDISVENFAVLDEEVSDHAALILEFS